MFTLQQSGYAEQTIQKSKFLAWAAACQSEREVAAFLKAIASKHATASHLAYAYRVKTTEGLILRFSDAGEPTGTAGKPIIQILEGRDLINICVGVIRYYGGINLGTGGLVRAYGGTAKLSLADAVITDYVEMQTVELTIAYQRLDELTKVVSQINGKIINKIFDHAVHVSMLLPVKEKQSIVSRFNG